MEIPILKGIVIIFALAIAVILVCHKLKIPSVVGYLITGVLAGPHGFELIKEIHEVETLAEIGIILLLFTIGIEFSLDKLLNLKKPVLVGGFLQLLLTAGLSFLLVKFLGLSTNQAIFTGFLVTLSSTAIVMKIMQERAEIDSPHGRAALGVLIFQDIAVVPMMLLVPILAGAGGNVTTSLVVLATKGIVMLVLVALSAKFIIPRVLDLVVRTKNQELFLLVIVVICFTIAWLTSKAGLSLALGAFLAGLIISESDYSYQAMGSILPFKNIFSSFFFVSIGMLFNLKFLINNALLVIIVTLVVILLKTMASSISALIIGYPLRSAILVGLALSQVGEFSFILSKSGQQFGLLSGDNYNLFLAVSIISMALTPFIIAAAPAIADKALKLPFPRNLKNGSYPEKEHTADSYRDHLVIVGFGINGKNVSRAAAAADIPRIILEMNPDIVKDEREKGEPIYQGDASQEAVLKHVNIKDAKVLVIAISDPLSARRITDIARRMNERVYLIVRTRYVKELEPLYDLGADEVIPEEFETSVEIFTRVLNKYLIPRDEIEAFVSDIRSDGYEMFRSLNKKEHHLSSLRIHVPEIEIYSIRITDKATVAGKTLAEIELRKKYKVTALAIRRQQEIILNPYGDSRMEQGDIIVVVGLRDSLKKLSGLWEMD